jgi:RHH-type proline utilization regulon transcriptional repressor/proline dehydrogenase/delta 1-pyrroline-5-carboxylate dehydrogenase
LLEKLCAALPDAADTLRAAAASDAHAWAHEFGKDHDPSALPCESNTFRYRPFGIGLVRADGGVSDSDLARVLLGAAATGTRLTVSLSAPRPWLEKAGVAAIVEDEAALCQRLMTATRVWYGVRAPGASPALKAAAIEAGLRLVDAPVLTNGRLELLWLLREQSVTETLHRYGNIMPTLKELGRA